MVVLRSQPNSQTRAHCIRCSGGDDGEDTILTLNVIDFKWVSYRIARLISTTIKNWLVATGQYVTTSSYCGAIHH